MNSKKAQKKHEIELGSKDRFIFERSEHDGHVTIVDCSRNLEMIVPREWRNGIKEFIKYFDLDQMPKKGVERSRQ